MPITKVLKAHKRHWFILNHMMQTHSQSQLFSKYRPFLFGFLLGVFAFILNCTLVIDAYGKVELYFGSAAVLLALLILPARFASFVLLASVAPLFILSTSLTIAWLAIAEFLLITAMMYAGIRFVTALSIFWLVIGLPITSTLVYLELSLTIQTSIFLALTFVLNSYICGLIALLIYWLLPNNSQLRYFEAPPKFSKLVFELNLISVLLPVFLVALFFTWRTTNDAATTVNLELEKAASELDRSINGLINDKIHALNASAVLIANTTDPHEHAKILDTVANASINIESMVITDENANLQFAAPERYAAMLPDLSNVNISHRSYFQLTKALKKPVVSDALEGRGLGSLDIVALTAPILKNNEFKGLVQAAIKLESLIDISLINAIQNNQIYIILIDSAGSIIYSSPEFTFNKLDKFQQDSGSQPSTFNMPEIGILGKSYLYQEHLTEQAWKIYTLTPPSRVFVGTNTYFVFVSITVLLSMILITLLSKGLAAKITRPLRNLEEFIQGSKTSTEILSAAKISQEMIKVTENVITTQTLSKDFQLQLKKEVEEKTQELQDVNAQLLTVSQTDSLTGLYNRRAFDQLADKTHRYCQRHKKSFSLALFDIDFFKKINDTYGHTAGDLCIVDVADIITSKCRRDTDIFARYGGEEFVLLLACDKPELHLDHIELIHRAIGLHKPLYNGKMIDLTISCGVIRVQNDFTLEMKELVTLADEQLYLSKRKGRNQVNSSVV
ncbi:diguanylate cyclase [Glaciecola sp. SC05]|uniref:sensor domain-containing diguanylate cyclase n=1 Tax=Glaciecola sp. SC05 TaxID=1987355 RepID=UPI003526D995